MEQKELIPMVPYLGTFFCWNSAGKFVKVHEAGESWRDRGRSGAVPRDRGTVVTVRHSPFSKNLQ